MNCLAIFIKASETGRKWFKSKSFISETIHPMLHQSLVIQTDYKQKIKFDWPNENHTM